jgi:PAS domain S-box-containing protein
LTTPEGVHIGTLCIIDYEPRPFDASQRETLERMADLVVNQFERRSAEAQVQQLVHENPQPMYVYAQDDGALLRANKAARDLYGHDDTSALTADDLRAPADEQPAAAALSMHRRADGSFFPVRLRTREVLFDGRAAILAVPQSVSERRNSDTTVFFQTDLEGTMQSLSAEWAEATGFDLADAVGGSLLDFVHPLTRSSTADVFSSLLDDDLDTCRHEADFLTKEGRRAFEMQARLVRDADGAATGVAGTLTPIIEADEAPAGSSATDPDEEPSPDETAEDEAPSVSSTDAPSSPSEADSDASDDKGERIGGVFSADLPSFSDATPSPPPDSPSPDADESPPDDARATAGSEADRTVHPEPFDLAAQLRDLLDDKARGARQENVALRRSLPEDALPVRLDPAAVRDVVDTMLDVALPRAEAVTVRVETQGARLSLHVEGAALSSPPAVLRSARRLAREMDGDLTVDDEGDGRLTLTLPRSVPPNGDGEASLLFSEAADE